MPECIPALMQRHLRAEAKVDRGLAGADEVVEGLLEVQQLGVYQQYNPDFRDYCRQRWPKPQHQRTISRLLAWEEIKENVAQSGPDDSGDGQLANNQKEESEIPVPNEAQARELGRLNGRPETQREIWIAVVTMARATKKRITAKAVRLAVEQYLAAESDEDPDPAEIEAHEAEVRRREWEDLRLRALGSISTALRRVDRFAGRLDAGEQEELAKWLEARPTWLQLEK